MGFSNARAAPALAAALETGRRITHIAIADGFTVEGVFSTGNDRIAIGKYADGTLGIQVAMQKNRSPKKDRKSADFIRDNINGMEFSDEYWLKDKERWQAMLPASPDSPV